MICDYGWGKDVSDAPFVPAHRPRSVPANPQLLQQRRVREPHVRELHDDTEPHVHDLSRDQKNAMAEVIWKTENVELTTVGIDIGSSTSHLMFARVHLQRKTQALSSQFVVVNRQILWRSPILLTPFLTDNTIDADRLRVFIGECHQAAGLKPGDIDSGAVILTGEAIKRNNARAIAQLFAAESGKFVCASAGHHMESVLAANGSGAVAISRQTHRTVLNVDIGGGTTKLALIKNGETIATCAFAVGGRLMAQAEDGRWTRIDEAAHQTAKARGITLHLNKPIPAAHIDSVVTALTEVLVSCIAQKPAAGLAKDLLLTSDIATDLRPDFLSFSGGVSEYIFNRESTDFGDLAIPLAAKIGEAVRDGRIGIPMLDPGQGIRATVIGASQFSVQLSGKTIHISPGMALPVYNVPVLSPAFKPNDDFSVTTVTAAVGASLARADLPGDQALALAIRWHGDPYHARLHRLAQGIAAALRKGRREQAPLILMVDGDIGRLLGHILDHELRVTNNIVSIDGIQLREFDYVDIGEIMQPANVVPVVIKSLLFSAGS